MAKRQRAWRAGMIFSIESDELATDASEDKIIGLIEEMSRVTYLPAFVGTYQATITGGDQGIFTFTIDKDGKIEGTGSTNQLGQQNFFRQIRKNLD